MATIYHDYFSPSYDLATRVSRLQLHICELEAMVNGPDVGADGRSINKSSLGPKIERLQRLYYTMKAELEAGTRNPASRFRFTRN